MRNLNVDSRGARIAEATAKIQSLGYDEQRRLAATTRDEVELDVLAGSDSDEILNNVLDNPFTSAPVLEKILDGHRTATDEDVLRSFTFRIATHSGTNGALQEYLSKHRSWEIRYSIATRADAPLEVLKALADDEHLAVKAMAAKNLGLPPMDDGFDLMEMGCAELNQAFEEFLHGLKSQKALADKMVESFGLEKGGYDLFSSFSRECFDALRKMRDNIIHHYAALMQRRYIPNIRLETTAIEKMMAALGEDYFDAYIIAAKVKELMSKSSELSIKEILSRARRLMPYAYSDDHSWGPASKPEQILRGKRLELRLHVRVYGSDHASIDSEQIENILALDKLSKVVLTNVDPADVDSHISTILYGARTPRDIFRKIPVGGVIDSIRFFKNGRFDIEYGSEERARKVAEALVSPPKDVG